MSVTVIDSHFHCGTQNVSLPYEEVRGYLGEGGIQGACLFAPAEDIYDRSDCHFQDTSSWAACRQRANRYLLDLQRASALRQRLSLRQPSARTAEGQEPPDGRGQLRERRQPECSPVNDSSAAAINTFTLIWMHIPGPGRARPCRKREYRRLSLRRGHL